MTQKEKDEKLAIAINKNLIVGQKVKNYKEMCEILGEKETKGNSKIAQIKNWNRFMDLSKVEGSQSYIIKEIYGTPKKKEAKNNAFHVKIIELLLTYELSGYKENTCQYTKTRLFHLLGMVNNNYLSNNRDMALQIAEELDEDIKNITEKEVNHFIDRTTLELNSILKSALNSMRSRALIEYQEVMMINYREGRFYKQREATVEETERILEIQKSILKDMGLKKIPFYNIKDFYDKVNKELKEKYGWNRAYKEYKLILNRQYMAGDIPVIEQEIEKIIKDKKLELNKNIMQTLKKQGELLKSKNEIAVKKNREIRAEEKKEILKNRGGFGEREVQEKEYETKLIPEYGKDYLKHQDKLAKIFIELGKK